MSGLFISLELNEINFESIERYIRDGDLPTFKALIERYGYAITQSESRYEELEPWIQWVTVHTGKTLAEHGVFRLGDIKGRNIEQIWERLERLGVKVGAMSPMNAENRLRDPAFFVPDPWTRSSVSGGAFLTALYDAISQAVNDNASGRMTLASFATLAAGAMRFAAPENYGRFVKLAASARSKPWARALFLDLLLADCFRQLVSARGVEYGTLFLNAGAHIQHHYLFSSRHFKGQRENPNWYVKAGLDPIYEVYAYYDVIIGQILRQWPDARLQIVTGLHQDPHPDTTYYWRLKHHEVFLKGMGLEFARAEPRMSRDFLLEFDSAEQADRARTILGQAQSLDGENLFSVDVRGETLFCELIYSRDVPDDFAYRVGNHLRHDLKANVAFVAIKNAAHNGDGYLLDTGSPFPIGPKGRPRLPLTALFQRTVEAFEGKPRRKVVEPIVEPAS